MDISEGTVFRSINTNKSKHFLKIEGAVDSQKNICIYNGYKGHFSFQEKKKTSAHHRYFSLCTIISLSMVS